MTIRLSTAARNLLLQSGGFSGAFNKGSINIYSGTQPATPDAAATGALLGTVTVSSLALTQETAASQTITVAGAAGSVNTVSVGGLNIIPGGAVPFRTDAATTASDLCDAINRDGLFAATVAGAVVTVKGRPGAGATYNAVSFATGVTTLTATVGAATMSGGVSAVNGLQFGAPASGVLSKLATQVWSFSGVAVGTAGWFRLIGAAADAAGISTTLPRVDGSVAVSGADLNLSNISVTIGGPNTIDTFSFTAPSQ